MKYISEINTTSKNIDYLQIKGNINNNYESKKFKKIYKILN